MEAQVGVYGQTLGFLLVYQRDTVEVIFQLLVQSFWFIPEILVHEIGAYGLAFGFVAIKYQVIPGMLWVKTLHQHTFLLGTFMIVLGLYLQKVVSGINIRPDAKFLPVGSARMMNVVHVAFIGIEIYRVVWSHALAKDILGIIFVTGHGEKFLQLSGCGDKLCVCAIHQAYPLHFCKGNGLVCCQYFVHCVFQYCRLTERESKRKYVVSFFVLFLCKYKEKTWKLLAY